MFAGTHFPVLLVLLVAVVGPLLAELPVGFRIPAVVLEVVWGIIIGPQAIGLVHFDGIVASMFAFGMAATLFMAVWNSNSKEFAAGPYGWRWAGGECRSRSGFLPQPCLMQARSRG
jgi:Kef-type K+ transport system membrane component KefB